MPNNLSKAFDVINHYILLRKLNSYGIRGLANEWFKNYLSERQQFVEIDEKKKITNGINSNRGCSRIYSWAPFISYMSMTYAIPVKVTYCPLQMIRHCIHHTPTNYMSMLMSRPIIYINGSAQTGCFYM